MLNADVISFREFVMHEPLPLAKIQEAVLEFLQGRDDAVLFGAQAVNAYVDEPRTTQDVNIMSNRAKEFAEELRQYLSERFHIAVRIREINDKGLRLFAALEFRYGANQHIDVGLDGKDCNDFSPSEFSLLHYGWEGLERHIDYSMQSLPRFRFRDETHVVTNKKKISPGLFSDLPSGREIVRRSPLSRPEDFLF